MNALKIGVVVAVYERGASVDVLLDDDGSRLANVQVLVPSASSNTGTVDLPHIGGPVDETRWLYASANQQRLMRAVVSFIRGIPICIGFLLPQVSQMTFDRPNFRIKRHASDVYSSINDTGDTEYYHPSGTYFRIGASPAHEDLTGKDFDQQFKVVRNTGAAPHVHLQVANAGAAVATIDIDPSGNISIQHNGNMTVNVGGNLQANVTGTADLKSPNVTIDSPQTTCTGALTVQGPLAFESGMTGQAGEGGGDTITINGTIRSTGDQIAGTISQIGHKHGGIQPGTGVSAVPQ
ncbi:hypothetical protein [Burkholderia anthina]|uniref:hypothetical protein n=1 Tax=Burkholderia anthina TaxID=179879 RepID=UPI001FC85203|nr:hypothetical protein [Burkholderia anthina]